MVLNPECPDDDDLEDEKFMQVYTQASNLYGLIHARYILTPRGKLKSLFSPNLTLISIRFGDYERKIHAEAIWALSEGFMW